MGDDKPSVSLFCSGDGLYPWGFSIKWRGITHEFIGMPNRCASKRSAAMRASWRVRWLLDGTFDKRYQTRSVA